LSGHEVRLTLVKRLAVLALVIVALVVTVPASGELAPAPTMDERVTTLETTVTALRHRTHRLRLRVRALQEEVAFQTCEVARLWEAIGRSSPELTAAFCEGVPTPDPAP
jgi:uncharacterized protein YoxC